MLDDPIDPMDETRLSEEDETFLLSWREEILDRTWQALEAHESSTGVPYNSVLRLRVSQPTLSSGELSSQVTKLLGRDSSPGSTRVLVHRARDKFANLLIEVISDSLQDNSDDAVEAELIELRLITYCREILANRKKQK